MELLGLCWMGGLVVCLVSEKDQGIEMTPNTSTEKTFFTNGGCPFIHDDISMLYGVPLMPREELPRVCLCGAPLTYASLIIFVQFPEDGAMPCHPLQFRAAWDKTSNEGFKDGEK